VDHFGEEEGLAAPPDDDFDEDGEPTAEGLDAAREALRRITGKTADEDDDALFAGLGDEPPPRARRAV
jgi:hypothetical protein